MPCLEEETVVGLIEGRLRQADKAAVEAHVDTCDACRRLVAEAGMALLDGGDEQPTVTDPARSAQLARGAQVGRYVVLDILGRGGMGTVYAAHDPHLDRKVALKLLHRRSPSLQRRLLLEARALARLRHPNVVTVFDAGTFEDRVFIAMEYIDGCTVRRWLRDGTRSWREIVDVFACAGRGLVAAHEAGLVHRDVKPDNILVGADGSVYVTDFGLVREAGSETSSLALAGTPAYMAPEQTQGQASAAADQYSFCVSLFEALCGERPVRDDKARIVVGEAKAKAAPRHVMRALRRGLALAPASRHASMAALLEELARATQARRRSAWPAIATAAGVAALIALTASIVVWGGQPRRDRAVTAPPAPLSAPPRPTAIEPAAAEKAGSAAAAAAPSEASAAPAKRRSGARRHRREARPAEPVRRGLDDHPVRDPWAPGAP